MLRTRDYFLLLVTIVFLTMGISATLFSKSKSTAENTFEEITLVPDSETEYVAVVTDEIDVSRQVRLTEMREKIKNDKNLFLYEDALTAEPEPVIIPEETMLASEMRCSGYRLTTTTWNPREIQFIEVEGARVVYKEVVAAASTGSTTPVMPEREVLAEIPLRSVPFGGQNCIPSDVIGITLGGSLIRNTDASLYAPFMETSLIGYALDGFPIYGTSNAATDACGGRMVSGQYQYNLSSDREVILNCYAGQPVSL